MRDGAACGQQYSFGFCFWQSKRATRAAAGAALTGSIDKAVYAYGRGARGRPQRTAGRAAMWLCGTHRLSAVLSSTSYCVKIYLSITFTRRRDTPGPRAAGKAYGFKPAPSAEKRDAPPKGGGPRAVGVRAVYTPPRASTRSRVWTPRRRPAHTRPPRPRARPGPAARRSQRRLRFLQRAEGGEIHHRHKQHVCMHMCMCMHMLRMYLISL